MSTFPRGSKLKPPAVGIATAAEPFLTRPTSDSNFKSFEFDAGLNSSAAWTGHLHEHELTKESEGDSLSIDDGDDGEGNSSSGRRTITGAELNRVDENDIGEELAEALDGEGVALGSGRPARVLYDCLGETALKELRVRAGDELEILRETIDGTDGWSLARVPRNVGGGQGEQELNEDKVGLVPREYYAFTTDFISSPADATDGSQSHRDGTTNEAADASTPRASTSTVKGPPLVPQNTGEWFRQQMRSVLGGRSLNRFSRFVTSGAEAFVLRGASPRPAPHEPDSKENQLSGTANESEGTGTEGLPPAHALRLSTFLTPETRGHTREPTAVPLEFSPDAHYIDVGESGPTWRSKVPAFEVCVHSPEKRYPVPGLSSIVGGAAGGGEAGAFIVYSITSFFDSPSSSDSDSDSDTDFEDADARPSIHAHNITVHRRFSHFVLLHSALSSLLPGLALPPLPEKQYAGRLNADFVDARRSALQRYLRILLRHPVVRYIEPLRFFLGCEDEVEWRKQLPIILKLAHALPSSSSSRIPSPQSFYANVYHPPFQVDLEDASDVSERFGNHIHAVAQGVQHMRGMFMKSVRQARVDMANAERSLGYEILGLINGRLAPGTTGDDDDEEEEDRGISPSGSPNGRTRRRDRQKRGIQNAEGAWCWREECSDCLRLTKCMQRTAETLQGVADLYDNHARRTMLETEDSLKDVAHPDAIYAPVLDIHRQTLERYKEASESALAQSLLDTQKGKICEADGTGAKHDSSKEEEDSVTTRCETVLNTTLAEFDTYHNAKRDDFERIVKSHLDGEIAFYEKVLSRLRTTRALFDASPTELDLLMPGARQPSIYERSYSSHGNQFGVSAEPLTPPAPHVLDNGRRATIRPVSDAIQGLLGIAAGSGGSKFASVNGVSGEGAEGSVKGKETNGSGSVFGRLW